MISLCINRAGTVPILDMSYHTPVVYIFSVLEVNIAILCASIPIFWPMISSFAADKILVVNEIVVHVEEYSKSSIDGQPGIGLAAQAAFKSPPESPSDTPRQHATRLSIISRTFDRTKDSNSTSSHRTRSSIGSSIDRTFSRTERIQRPSQESQRNLYRVATQETGSLTKSEYDWFTELDKQGADQRATGDLFQSPKPKPSGV